MSAQGTQRHSSASQSKGIVIRSTTTPYSGELPLLIRSNISQKYTARGRKQFSFRDWLVDQFVVFYYVIPDGIEVAGVVHGSRDIEGLFRRGEK